MGLPEVVKRKKRAAAKRRKIKAYMDRIKALDKLEVDFDDIARKDNLRRKKKKSSVPGIEVRNRHPRY